MSGQEALSSAAGSRDVRMATVSEHGELVTPRMVTPAASVLLYTKALIVVLAIVCAGVQLMWHEPGDVYVLAVLLGTAMCFYALRSSVLEVMPISCLALIGCGMSNFFLPLVITTVESKPLTFELQRPDLTFGFNLLAFATLIACHGVYSSSLFLQSAREAISLRLLSPLGIFILPTPFQLMAIGGVGLGSMLAVSLVFGARPEENFGDAFLKTLEALSPLAYAPYLIVLYPIMGGRVAMSLKNVAFPIALFSFGLLVAGSASNSRTAVFLGFASIALGLILGAWTGSYPPRMFRPRNLLIACVALLLAFPVAERLASAMVVVRAENFEGRPLQALTSTFSAFISADSLSAFRNLQEQSTISAKWHGGDEYYLDNLFFARLGNMKFADNTLSIVADLDRAARWDIADREVALALSILPQPLLTAFGSDIDKQSTRGSMGSFIYSLALGRPEVAGYFATGSYLTSAWACFGWAFPFVIAIIALILFPCLDSFSLPALSGGAMIIAPVALLGLYTTSVLFTSAAMGSESVSEFIRVVLRDLPQQALLYALVLWVVRQLRGGERGRAST
jgi:hypothetical protein